MAAASFKSFFDRLMRPGFGRSVATLLSGAVPALAISYLVQPILTRLYTPEAFGVMDGFLALVIILVPFASLRYDDAIMLPADDREASSVFSLSFALMVTCCVLVTIAGLIIRETDLPGERFAALIPWLWLVGPALFLMRTMRLAEQWLTRKKHYKPVAAGQFLQMSGMTTTRLGAGFAVRGIGALGLIAGYVVGNALAAFYLIGRLFRNRRTAPILLSSWKAMHESAVRYKRFPFFSMPSTLLNNLVSRLPLLLFFYYFDERVVGLYGRAFVALAIPLSIIGAAVAQVFFVEGAEARHKGGLTGLTQSVHERLIWIGLFPAIALTVAGPDLFAFVFGEPWREAGVYAQYISLWMFLGAVASPLTRLFDILERQRTDFLTSLMLFILLLAAIILGGRSGSVERTLIYLAIGGSIGRVIHLRVMMGLAGIELAKALKAYRAPLVLSILLGLPLWAAQIWALPWVTALVLVITGGLYGLAAIKKL